ncbi:non-ribosomal peptide synthetase, partial [Streptomyces microflavus]
DDRGLPGQLVSEPGPFIIDTRDLRHIEHRDSREDAARRILDTDGLEPIDLGSGMLLRTLLVRLADDEHILAITVHHIAFDGWSVAVLARELTELYTSAVGAGSAELPVLPMQYADYAVWQREWLTGDVLERQLAHWRATLADLEPLELPTDHRRPAERTGAGEVVTFGVPAAIADRVKAIGAGEGASLFMTLLAVFQVLLSKYSGQEDIAVGTPIAGRNRAEIEDMIGFFVNTLVMRTDLAGDPTFTELLGRVRDTALGAYDHQDLPFERLVEELAPERDLSRNPLFQTMFVLQAPGGSDAGSVDPGSAVDAGSSAGAWEFANARVQPVDIARGFAKFDLQLTVVELSGGGLRGAVEFRTDLFERATVERLAGHFRMLLAGVAANPHARVSELEMLTPREHRRIVVEWNDTTAPYPDTATIHSLVEDRVRRCPDAVAITHGTRTLTYTDVNERANLLAHHLRAAGIGPNTLVAVCLDRGPDLICALLGILKAGAAYVPLDPDYPTDRLTHMIRDTATPLILTHTHHTERLPHHTPRLLVDHAWPTGPDTTDPPPLATPDDLAYVIYTSGSTGRPKGVRLPHRGVVNYLHWCDLNYPPHPHTDAIGSILYSSVTFDLTVTALFLPQIQGLRLDIPRPTDGESVFDAAVATIATGMPISFLKATPSHLEILAAHLEHTHNHHAITTIVAGGEDLSPHLAHRILTTTHTTTTICNEYGPTEASVANVMSLSTAIDPHADGIPIGVPITNTKAYVVDRHNRAVPVGVPGECLVGGICVGRGYLDRPELTEARFVPDPFSTDPDARVYRTGDLVKWRPDGRLEYIGRIDNQVKLRGYRIELGEIESMLLTHPGVTATTVIVREDTPGDRRLVAYLVAGGAAVGTGELRTHLRRHLPDHMVPALFVTLDRLPLTPNGKVDRKALPVPDGHRPDLDAAYLAPRTPVEETIATIWSQVLGVDTVGAHDNFFELGGHSLLATRVTSRLRTELGVDTPVRTLFGAPTPAMLAAAVADLDAGDSPDMLPAARTAGPLPL